MSNSGIPDTIRIDDLTVPRFGFGAMRLPGPGVWGPPADRDEAINVVRRAYQLGIRLIDTAWYYGLDIANGIIADALHPYPDDLVIVTKLGGNRRPDGSWFSDYSEAAIRTGCERDLRVLKLESIPIVHLRYIEQANVSFPEALATMLRLREEGLVQRIGLSNVTAAQLRYALTIVDIATVSNQYSVLDRANETVLAACEEHSISFLPYFPLVIGKHGEESILHEIASKHAATTAQIALKWLLAHSLCIIPIPGTGSVAHLEENVASTLVQLTPEDMASLDAIRLSRSNLQGTI